MRRARLWTLVLLAPVASFLLFTDLGAGSFQGDEALYAAVTLDTTAAGRLLPLTVDGGDYVSKPVGGFLLLRAAFELLGATEFAARLPSALAALATVLLVGDAAARWLGGAYGLVAGIVLASARRGLEFHGFRSGTFDALVTLSVLVTVLLWVESRRGERPALWRGACVVSALSTLVKYLAAPALAATAVLFGELALARRLDRDAILRALGRAAMLVAAGAAVFVGYVAVLWALGVRDLFGELVHRDLVLRAQGDLHRFRQPGAGYFLEGIARDLGLTLLLLVPFAAGLWRRWRDREVDFAERTAWIGIASAALGPLLAVSLFRSRLPWYSLPAYPGIALALGAGLSELTHWRARPALVGALGMAIVAARLGAGLDTLRAPAIETPLRGLAAALDAAPEARFFMQPGVEQRATSPHGIVRPQSYVYLRQLEARAIRDWPSPADACAVVYLHRLEARRRAESYGTWRRLELSGRFERDGEDYLLLESCKGKVLDRIEVADSVKTERPVTAIRASRRKGREAERRSFHAAGP